MGGRHGALSEAILQGPGSEVPTALDGPHIGAVKSALDWTKGAFGEWEAQGRCEALPGPAPGVGS